MNVLVVVVRGWPLGYLGCYGNPWIATPTLDEFASASVVFDGHIADAVDEKDIRRTWTSGQYHLPGANPGPANLLGKLRAAGVKLYRIEDADHPTAWPDESDWDDVDCVQAEGDDPCALPVVLDAACTRLESFSPNDPPWLLWVELSTLFSPWHPPSEYLESYFTEGIAQTEEGIERRVDPLEPLLEIEPGPIDPEDDELFDRVQNSFAAVVSYVDSALGELLTTAAEQNLLDDTVVLITSDRGQALGEHNVLGDTAATVHEEIVHVPLVVRLPKAEEGGRRILGLTQAIDLAPTLAEWFGVALDSTPGHSLLPLMRGEVEEVRPFAVSGRHQGDRAAWAMRTSSWSLLKTVPSDEDDSVRLYLKPEDRWEVNDVRLHHLADRDELEASLTAFLEANCGPNR